MSTRSFKFKQVRFALAPGLALITATATAGVVRQVSTTAELSAAVAYWASSSTDLVTIEIAQGSYALDATSVSAVQPAGKVAGLTMQGGYSSDFSTRSKDATSTVLDGQNTAQISITANGDVTLDTLVIQQMSDSSELPFVASPPISINSSAHRIKFNNMYLAFNKSSKSESVVRLGASESLSIWNSLFYKNTDACGAAIGCGILELGSNGTSTPSGSNGFTEIYNTTIAANTGNGLALDDATYAYSENDIWWANSALDVNFDATASSISISYSDFTPLKINGMATFGAGNISADPQFSASSYALQTGSPAINAGDPKIVGYTYPVLDLAGNQRIVSDRIDLGPYESQVVVTKQWLVSNTGDSPLLGSGSLRAAVLNASTYSGTSDITFAIPGGPSCSRTIILTAPLPDIAGVLSIDGKVAGWQANSATRGAFNANECITISGAGTSHAIQTASSASGSRVNINALNFVGFSDAAIKFEGGQGHVVSASTFSGNDTAVHVTGNAGNVTIGGSDASTSNLIDNGTVGIYLDNATGGNSVSNNVIGIGANGIGAQGNEFGVAILSAPLNFVESNYIGNSSSAGVYIDGAGGNVVQDNYIGADIVGGAQANQIGVWIVGSSNNVIGQEGFDLTGGNTIQDNFTEGVLIDSGHDNSVVGNNLIANDGPDFNAGLAIDLGTAGPDSNASTSTGPNDLQHHPVLSSAVYSALGGQVTVAGTLSAVALTRYRIDLFQTFTPGGYAGTDPRGIGGSFAIATSVQTDAQGNANFSVSLPGSVSSGIYISATATSYSVSGGFGGVAHNLDTSEISNAVQVKSDDIFAGGFDH